MKIKINEKSKIEDKIFIIENWIDNLKVDIEFYELEGIGNEEEYIEWKEELNRCSEELERLYRELEKEDEI